MEYIDRLIKSLEPVAHEAWFPYAIGVAGILFGYSIVKTLSSLPKLVMYPIVGATVFIVFMHWIYHRNEPEFLTPLVNMLSMFFPNARGA